MLEQDELASLATKIYGPDSGLSRLDSLKLLLELEKVKVYNQQLISDYAKLSSKNIRAEKKE